MRLSLVDLKYLKMSNPQKMIPTKLRPKVPCYCKKCNGKYVETRTRKKHEQDENRLQASNSSMKKRQDKERPSIRIPELPDDSKTEESTVSSQNPYDDDIVMIDSDHNHSNDNRPEKSVHIRKKRRRHNRFRETFDIIIDPGEEPAQFSDSSSDEDDFRPIDDFNDNESDFDVDDDDELFAAPSTNLNYDPDEEGITDINDPWILLWIFKYQERFRLPDVAVSSLISFFSLVLKTINPTRFKEFPSSAYMARKLLDIKKKSKTFAVCTDCNKLYDPEYIIPKAGDNTNLGFKCTNIEFPDHPIQKYRESCGSELLTKVPTSNGYKWCPKMVYPLPCLKAQLTAMYKRHNFEELLKKWANRDTITNVITDIYDGEIWKNFPSNLDNPTSRFFTDRTADSNLGLMINLDWFQPFEFSVYSCGAIYGVICNLPRDIRFKKENMLTLGLLPGPNEVKLDRINHYLSPIIDELLELWNGFDLPISDKYPTGKKIRLAMICCSNDIPAARKLCGHISALVACHRCYKIASGTEGQRANFGGFEDINDWFKMKDPVEHRLNAIIWKKQLTKDDRKRHVSRTLVRWSEMLRLPYFDPIRFLVVDPMHNLFLGIAHWIVKRLWIDSGKITKSDLELMEKRAKKIKVPADLGRIPYKIATGEGFSGFTADQWKSFIMIYATTIMWDLLSESDQKILANFVRACFLLTTRIIDNNALDEAHSRLLNVALLVEENYGPEVITPNIHLSLHLAECCRDYGPIYSFWCYSFERMNGILGNHLPIFVKKRIYIFY